MTDTQPDTGDTTPDATPAQAPADPDTGTDLAAELEKWKSQARKHEQRAKANAEAAKELEKLRSESMTEQERAVEAAKAATRAELLIEVGSRLVDAEVRAAAAGRSLDVDALLDGLDRSRFIDDDGEPDRDAIASWVDRIAPQGTDTPPRVDLGQGVRTPESLGNDDELTRGLKSALGIR